MKFKRSISILLVFVLLSMVLLPYSTLASQLSEEDEHKKLAEMLGYKDFNIIRDSGNHLIYQYSQEGTRYEVHEKSVDNSSFSRVSTEIYIVVNQKNKNKTEKRLVDSFETRIEKNNNKLQIAQKNNIFNIDLNSFEENSHNGNVSILSNDVRKSSAITGYGYWEFNSGTQKGNARAWAGTNWKNTTQTNSDYLHFKYAVNSLVNAEIGLTGWVGLLDIVWQAVRNGQILTLETLRRILGQAGKAIPGIGTLVAIIAFANAASNTKERYEAI